MTTVQQLKKQQDILEAIVEKGVTYFTGGEILKPIVLGMKLIRNYSDSMMQNGLDLAYLEKVQVARGELRSRRRS